MGKVGKGTLQSFSIKTYFLFENLECSNTEVAETANK